MLDKTLIDIPAGTSKADLCLTVIRVIERELATDLTGFRDNTRLTQDIQISMSVTKQKDAPAFGKP